MSQEAGQATQDLVEKYITADGVTPADVWRQLQPLWAPATIRHAIRALLKRGRITCSGKVCRRKYMRLG